MQSSPKKQLLCTLILLIIATSYLACTKSNTKPAVNNTPVTISSISVNTGTYNTTVVITGTGFDTTPANDKVYFNGKAATVSSATTTQLTVAVPQDAGTGNITLSVDNGVQVSGPIFTYNTTVTISSISVNSGPFNTVVAITGTGFDTTPANDKVFFNGKAATVSAATTTQLTVTVPLNAATGNITLSVDNGALITGPLFTYQNSITPATISSISINSGPYNAVVVITGTGFDPTPANNKVFFNGMAATVSSATVTQLTVNVPLSAGTGNITVSVNNASPVSGPVFTYQLSAIVTTLAGGTRGANNGTGTAASFNAPTGVAVDPSGIVYVADKGNNQIRKITPDGVVTTIAGTNSSSPGSINGTGIGASFYNPSGIATDAAGNMYVADVSNALIRKVTPAGVVSTYAGSINTTTFNSPTGVALDAGGNIYVADFARSIIYKIFPGPIIAFAGSGVTGSTDNTGTNATFNQPTGVGTDAAGNVYVADTWNNRIRKINPAGVVTTLAGHSSGSANGTGTNASFNQPTGVAIDAGGNVYVADAYNGLIRMITQAGVVTTLAGTTRGYVDGPGTSAKFQYLSGIAIDAAGNIYVADTGNNAIRKITLK